MTVTATEDQLESLDRDGYVILENAIEADLVAELRETIRRLQSDLGIEPRRTLAEGQNTLRIYNLLAKDPVFARVPAHPAVLGVVEQMLDRGCLLSGMTAIDIGPGEKGQPIHGDDLVMSHHLRRPHAPMMVTTMWALTDFTEANGGTRYVPGSHRWAATPFEGVTPEEPREVALEMPAGSVMVFHASLWHGGGPNVSDQWRLGINVQYCPGFVRQQQNPYLGIPSDVAASFDDRVLELLGYKLYRGIMGHVDGASPGEVVFGERFAETAYRAPEASEYR